MPGKTTFDTSYAFTLKRVLDAPAHLNVRTEKLVRAVDGVFMRIGGLPILNLRDIKPLWTCAETVWFMGGRADVRFMQRFGFKNWNPFADRDGTISSATGYRWRHAHGVDQLDNVIKKLRTDPSNRQAVLLSWLPKMDAVKPGPNAPCLLAWHLHCIGDHLHMSVMQRSADMYFGFPHDVLGSRIVQELVAAAIGVFPGNLSYMIGNAHLYEDQWKAAAEMVAREDKCEDIADYPQSLGLTHQMASAALSGDDKVVGQLEERIKAFYRPFPPLTGPRLVQ